MLCFWLFNLKAKLKTWSTSIEIYPESRVTPVSGPDNLSPVDSEGACQELVMRKLQINLIITCPSLAAQHNTFRHRVLGWYLAAKYEPLFMGVNLTG